MIKDGTPLDITLYYGWDEIVKILLYKSEGLLGGPPISLPRPPISTCASARQLGI